jgi:hypothetical protein
MAFLDSVTTYFLRKRMGRIERMMAEPIRAQELQWANLRTGLSRTAFGQEHGITDKTTYADYRNQVPVRTYEDIYPYIDKAMQGERNVLWPGRVRQFAKSSGTTGQRSKFIPVTDASLEACHYRGGKDMIGLYLHNHPGSRVLFGKTLSVGGSLADNEAQSGSKIGDVSALIMNGLPGWAQRMRVPGLEIATYPEWERKLEAIAQATIKERVTSLTGVPTWMYILMKRVLEITGATDLRQIWPDLEVFIHGAVSFVPYRPLFDSLTAQPLFYQETYSASEGYFGQQDRTNGLAGEMALMLDYGILYEFIVADEFRRGSDKAVPLGDVEMGREYALVISTNGGLWRYLIGDTIRFTSTKPFRFTISGRTKHFINAFGEEVVVENAEEAVRYANGQTGARVLNYTVAPVYMGGKTAASHQWAIEFEQAPASLDTYGALLDTRLREVNSDYDAKRYRDIALHPPQMVQVPEGTFYRWLQQRGKLGGQHKVPRLSNTREYIDEILALVKEELG